MKIKLNKLLGAIGKTALKVVTGGKIQLDDRDRVDVNSGIDVLDLVVEDQANAVIDRRVQAQNQKRDPKTGKFQK